MNFKNKEWMFEIKNKSRITALVFSSLSIILSILSFSRYDNFIKIAEVCYAIALVFYSYWFGRISSFFQNIDFGLTKILHDHELDINNGANLQNMIADLDYIYYKFCGMIICWFITITIVSIVMLIKFWMNYMLFHILLQYFSFILITYLSLVLSSKYIEKIVNGNKSIKNKIKGLINNEIH